MNVNATALKEARFAQRRRWKGNLNEIPITIAYDFELEIIAANEAEDGMCGSEARVNAAWAELQERRRDKLSS